MPTVNAADIIGKTLIAKTNVNIRSSPTTNAKVLSVAKSGNNVGIVYSWVYGKDAKGVKDGSVWWQLEGEGFVKHVTGWYDYKSLQDQGVKTTAEKLEEKKEEDKGWGDKLADFLKGGTKKVLIGAAVIFVAVKLGTTLIETNAQRRRIND